MPMIPFRARFVWLLFILSEMSWVDLHTRINARQSPSEIISRDLISRRQGILDKKLSPLIQNLVIGAKVSCVFCSLSICERHLCFPVSLSFLKLTSIMTARLKQVASSRSPSFDAIGKQIGFLNISHGPNKRFRMKNTVKYHDLQLPCCRIPREAAFHHCQSNGP